MADKPPSQVYPDPDGTTNAIYVPSNTNIAAGSLLAGAASVGAAAAGTGAAVEAGDAFLQSAVSTGTFNATIALVSAVPLPYISATIVFGLISLGLGTWNLVQGHRMKSRLQELSQKVWDRCPDLMEAYRVESEQVRAERKKLEASMNFWERLLFTLFGRRL